MICVAAVTGDSIAGNNEETCFLRWRQAVDPARMRFDNLHSARYPWGWLAISGFQIEQYPVQLDGGQMATLYLEGTLLSAELLRSIRAGQADQRTLEELRLSNGQYIYVVVGNDPSRWCFECGSDGMGTRPLFFACRDQSRCFSTHASLCAMLNGQAALDVESVRDYVIKDCLLPEACLLSGVRRLKRGQAVHWDGRELTVSGDTAAETSTVRLEEACQSLVEAAKGLPSYPMTPLLKLTGGKDSRLVMSSLLAAGVSFEAITHSHPCEDSLKAGSLTSAVGVKHWMLPVVEADPVSIVSHYFGILPLTDGLASFPPVDASRDRIEDFIVSRGMLELGGAFGAAHRGYWDNAALAANDSSTCLFARLFQPKYDILYPSCDTVKDAMDKWLSVLKSMPAPDEFAALQVLWLDGRFRGVIAMNCNAAPNKFAWLLANRQFYCHSLQRPRHERQAAAVFKQAISLLASGLLNVTPFTVSSPPVARQGTSLNPYRRLRRLLSQSTTVHKCRGALLNRKERHSGLGRMRLAFMADPRKKEWLGQFFSPDGISQLATCSKTFLPQIDRLMGIYFFNMFLEQLNLHPRSGHCDWRRQALDEIFADSAEQA
ncbi:MAG: hypothetical protein LLG01_16460 [Planctomycetaceae bacterium]|nr:hypothetical protein [Planctomycetaceae bacterium]